LTNAGNKVLIVVYVDLWGVGFWTCYFYLGQGCYFYWETCQYHLISLSNLGPR
jgi:hypothetical protein